MDRKPPADPIKFHPMLMRIIDAYARGESATSIAKWASPPLSVQVIAKYFRDNVRPAIEAATRLHVAKQAENESHLEQEGIIRPAEQAHVTVKNVAMTTLVGKRSLAIRENRVALQQDLVRRLAMVADERSEEMSVCAHCGRAEEHHPIGDDNGSGARCDAFIRIAGGASGLIARDIKGANDTPVYRVDTGMIGEMRELMKHAAIELGQWNENLGGSVSIQVLCPIAPNAENAPRIVIGAEGTIEAEPDSYEEIGVIQGR